MGEEVGRESIDDNIGSAASVTENTRNVTLKSLS